MANKGPNILPGSLPMLPCSLLESQLLQALAHHQSAITCLVSSTKTTTEQLSKISKSLSQLVQSLPTADSQSHYVPELIRSLSPLSSHAFELKLMSSLPTALHKGKLFNLNIRVKRLSESVLHEEETFSVALEVYTGTYPPEELTHNSKGRPILECNRHSSIVQYHSHKKAHVAFLRVKFQEVTSHLPNGWVLLVVKQTESSGSGVLVKPLVIEHVVVRAKNPTVLSD